MRSEENPAVPVWRLHWGYVISSVLSGYVAAIALVLEFQVIEQAVRNDPITLPTGLFPKLFSLGTFLQVITLPVAPLCLLIIHAYLSYSGRRTFFAYCFSGGLGAFVPLVLLAFIFAGSPERPDEMLYTNFIGNLYILAFPSVVTGAAAASIFWWIVCGRRYQV